MSDAQWSDEDSQRLTVLWAGDKSAAQIGQELKRTKSGILRRVHRMGLPPRPSPIIRDGRGRQPRTRKPRIAKVNNVVPFVRDSQPVINRSQSGKPCQFIVNSRKPFRFCDGGAVSGGVYCENHAALCYRPRNAWGRFENA